MLTAAPKLSLMPHSLVNATLVAAAAFFEAAERCLRKDRLALVNFCLERKSDPTADRIAAGFKERSWRVRLLDSPGGERNAIVLAGKVRNPAPAKIADLTSSWREADW